MDKEEIFERLNGVFKSVFENENLVLSEDLSPDNVENWDSLTQMMLIEGIEAEFGFRFKLSDLKNLNNVKNIIKTITSYRTED